MEQECKRTCPYCGGASSGRYCPDCGQPLQASPKITMKLFWKEAAMSFTSLTPGFWNTFVGLLLHPWEVIRQYIHGQRANLSSPITMMMQLLLYSAFFYTILGHIFHIDFYASNSEDIVIEGHWFLTMLINSDVVAKILIASMPAFCCHIAYGRTTGSKYNLAEYMTAAIYMGCAFSIYFNLLKPLEVFYTGAVRYIGFSIVLIVGTIALSKAFPIRQGWRRCLTWLGFILLNGLTFLIVVLIGTIIKMISG